LLNKAVDLLAGSAGLAYGNGHEFLVFRIREELFFIMGWVWPSMVVGLFAVKSPARISLESRNGNPGGNPEFASAFSTIFSTVESTVEGKWKSLISRVIFEEF
jgi:hypothetical protein